MKHFNDTELSGINDTELSEINKITKKLFSLEYVSLVDGVIDTDKGYSELTDEEIKLYHEHLLSFRNNTFSRFLLSKFERYLSARVDRELLR